MMVMMMMMKYELRLSWCYINYMILHLKMPLSHLKSVFGFKLSRDRLMWPMAIMMTPTKKTCVDTF